MKSKFNNFSHKLALIAIQAVTVVGKAAFGMAVNQAVQRLKDYRPKSSSDSKASAREITGKDSHNASSLSEPKESTQNADLTKEFARLDELRSKLQQKVI
jgi:hypothetical protein